MASVTPFPPYVTELYQRYRKNVRAYAHKLLGSALRSHLDDVEADVWVDLLRNFDRFPPLQAPPHPENRRFRYLYVIVSRKVSKLRRKLGSDNKVAALLKDGETLTSGPRRLTRRKCKYCGRPTKRAEECEAHYYRRRRHGDKADLSAPVNLPRKLSDLVVKEIRNRLSNGEKNKVLAIEYGVSAVQISKIKNGRQRGGEPTPLVYHRLSEERIQDIVTLRNQGWTQDAIARHIGVTQAAVWKHLRKADLLRASQGVPIAKYPKAAP